MAERRRYSPEKRKAMLVDIAIETFADMGIERAGHGDIAKRAGVSTATVFNYFPTKEALMLGVLGEIEAQIIRMFETAPDLGEGPRHQVLALAKAYEIMIREHPATIKAYLAWSVSFNPDLRPQYLDMQDRILDLIQSNLPPALKNKTDALIVTNAANMMAIMTFDNRSSESLQKFTARLIDALIPVSNK
jgi:TetR/AcrR family hemagglutinin/protease transcriptional regulator